MRTKTISNVTILILIIAIVLCGCTKNSISEKNISQSEMESEDMSIVPTEAIADGEYHLDDSEDVNEYEQLIYQEIIEKLDGDYLVEDVNVAYYSDEYLQDVAYNSKESVFFGYSFNELDKQFTGTKYAFTLGDNGETIVHEFENYDFTTETILKNVAIGTGVILICVIVTVATSGASAPGTVAVIYEFAGSMAKYAIIGAATGSFIGGLTEGIVTGLETGDMDAAIKAAALEASESYKWGAITGAATGGLAEGAQLLQATRGGLTVSEAAFIQKETKLPAKFIKQIKSMDEYYEIIKASETGGLTISQMADICTKSNYPLELVKSFRTTEEGMIYCEKAGLFAKEVNGKIALIRDIDLNYTTETAGKMMTNLERMKAGYAAIDPLTGESYQLHHIGQSIDSPLAILTKAEHTGGGNNTILHDVNIGDGSGVHSLLSNSEWSAQKQEFWKGVAELLGD